MDSDGFSLEKISEKSDRNIKTSLNGSQIKHSNEVESSENIAEKDEKSPTESNNRRKKKIKPLETSMNSERSIETLDSLNENKVELESISDEDDGPKMMNSNDFRGRSVSPPIDQATMLSSYTTGDDNDVIEIHQFSENDIDAYLDIYFQTLNNRLRHHIGGDEKLQQFRNSMKTRIKGSPNAREYQDVLLGKINDDVVAAVTMSFPDEAPTIPLVDENPQENSCFKSIKSWITRHANYIPVEENECYIEMIGVKSSFQNRGIGAAMLQCVEHFAQQAGATWLTIHVNGDMLKNYFHRFGFDVDQSDYSALWKWIVEKESISKLRKPVSSLQDGFDHSANSYFGDSITENTEP